MKYDRHIKILQRAKGLVAGANIRSDQQFLCFALQFATSDVFREDRSGYSWEELRYAMKELLFRVHKGLEGRSTVEGWVSQETWRKGIRVNLSGYFGPMNMIRMAWLDKMISEYEEWNADE